MVNLSTLLQYVCIVVGISAGAIALYIFVSCCYGTRCNENSDIESSIAKNGAETENDLPQVSSGETFDSSESHIEEKDGVKNKRIRYVMHSPNQRESSKSHEPIPSTLRKHNSLLDSELDEELADGTDESLGGTKNKDGPSELQPVRNEAKLAAAWKLRALDKEENRSRDKACHRKEKHEEKQVSSVLLFPSTRLICGRATKSCMLAEPATISIQHEDVV